MSCAVSENCSHVMKNLVNTPQFLPITPMSVCYSGLFGLFIYLVLRMEFSHPINHEKPPPPIPTEPFSQLQKQRRFNTQAIRTFLYTTWPMTVLHRHCRHINFYKVTAPLNSHFQLRCSSQ